jgi:CysZ protein
VFILAFGVFFFFILNWTFTLIISLIGAPFFDLISSRVERKVTQLEVPHSAWLSWVFIKNQILKILVLVFISILCFVFSYIPFLFPIYLILSSILITFNFLDFTWSRKNMTLTECLRDWSRSKWSYGFSGFIYFVLLSVPLLNIFFLSLAVIHFTLLYLDGINLRNSNYEIPKT